MQGNTGQCCRLAIQEKPFAAPLRLIAAGLSLHSPFLAPPPYKYEGSTCVPRVPGSDTHSTAAAQGAACATMHAQTASRPLSFCQLHVAIQQQAFH